MTVRGTPLACAAALLIAALGPAVHALEPGESEALRELESLAQAAPPPVSPQGQPARPSDGFTPQEHEAHGRITEGLKALEACAGAPQERIKGCVQDARARIEEAGRWAQAQAQREPAYGSPSDYDTALEAAQGLDACVQERDETSPKEAECQVSVGAAVVKGLLFFSGSWLLQSGRDLWRMTPDIQQCGPATVVKRTILELDKGCLSSAAGKLRDSIPAPILEGLAGLAAPIEGEKGTSRAVLESRRVMSWDLKFELMKEIAKDCAAGRGHKWPVETVRRRLCEIEGYDDYLCRRIFDDNHVSVYRGGCP